MKRGQKVTLEEARETGSAALSINCMNHTVQGGGCFHSSEMSMLLALALWGGEQRLDELPLQCSVCGSRKVDVRPNPPAQQNDGALDMLIRKAWERKT